MKEIIIMERIESSYLVDDQTYEKFNQKYPSGTPINLSTRDELDALNKGDAEEGYKKHESEYWVVGGDY